MFRKENLKAWARTILEDEFNNLAQNAKEEKVQERIINPGEAVAGEGVLRRLITLHPPRRPWLDVGCGSGELRDFDFFLDPSSIRGTSKVRRGWIENIPHKSSSLGCVVAWGMMFFVRSYVEAFIEVNRTLEKGGSFVFDVCTFSTMPIVQTVEGESFLRWCQLFGFSLVGVEHFGHLHHKRMGVHLRKTREFDPAYFRMPQAAGGIRNFVLERDWYLR